MSNKEEAPKLITKEEETKIEVKIDPYFSYSCPQCALIPEILIIDRIKGIIKIKCSTHGDQEIKLSDSVKSLTINNCINSKCEICSKFSKKIHKKFCIHCNKIICKECLKNHESNEKLLNVSEMNTKCHLHLENFLFYCYDCDKSLCESCISSREHKFHKKDLLNELEPNEEKINYFENLNEKYLKEKNMLLMKIEELDNLIKLNELLLNSFKKNPEAYRYIMNINNLYQQKDTANEEVFEKENKEEDKTLIKDEDKGDNIEFNESKESEGKIEENKNEKNEIEKEKIENKDDEEENKNENSNKNKRRRKKH